MTNVNGVLVPRRSFVTYVDGRMVRFRKGLTTVRHGHPILKGRHKLFRPLEVKFDVEAEAAPSEPAKPAKPSLPHRIGGRFARKQPEG